MPYCLDARCLPRVVDLLPRWLSACANVGAYEESIRLADDCLASPDWIKIRIQPEAVRVLQTRGKALRNLGKFKEALDSYRDAIQLAESAKNDAKYH